MPLNVGLHPPARFAEQVFFPIWGDDWLNRWASRTQHTAAYLERWLADDNMHHRQQRLLDDMLRVQLDLELRRLGMAIEYNILETEAIFRSSGGKARGLIRLYADGGSMRTSRHRIERLLHSIGRRTEAYDAWINRGGDPDERDE